LINIGLFVFPYTLSTAADSEEKQIKPFKGHKISNYIATAQDVRVSTEEEKVKWWP